MERRALTVLARPHRRAFYSVTITMPVQALRSVAKSQNGVGAFILQCKRLDFHYCDWAGSSRGMKSNPGIEITVSPRPAKHPVIRGSYINGREKVIDCRNITPNEIAQKVELLRNANGEKLKRTRKPVKSLNESEAAFDGIPVPYG
nr:54s ribosomal protein l51, mitochondrial [Quercus suber]